MRHLLLTIFLLISLPLIFVCLELLHGFSIPGFLNSQDAWVPLCVAVLTSGVVLSLLRLANRTNRGHHRH
jgi:hypothetical protein